jgi:hypothetical protein
VSAAGNTPAPAKQRAARVGLTIRLFRGPAGAADARNEYLAFMLVLRLRRISAIPNTPTAMAAKVDAVRQFPEIHREARRAIENVAADHAQQQAEHPSPAPSRSNRARATAVTSASTISEIFGRARARCARRSARARNTVATFPRRTIRWPPRRRVRSGPAAPSDTVDRGHCGRGSPGKFTRIAVVEPPYARRVDAREHDERRHRRQ